MFALRVVPIGLILLCSRVELLRSQLFAVQPGERVRLRTNVPQQTIEGVVLRAAADTLTLAPGGGKPVLGKQLLIPLGAVQALDVWRGRRSAWRLGAEIGSFAGFVTASTIFAARMSHCVGVECAKSLQWVSYGSAGSVAGALLGGLLGAAFTQDTWESVPIAPGHPQVAVVGGSVRVMFSVQ